MEASKGKHEQPVLLVLRALKLGDLLVAVPALRALRRAYPGHRLLYAAQDWLEDALELVGGYELLPTHGLDVPIPVEAGTVDIAVNLHGSGPESEARLAAVRPRTIVGHRTSERPGPAWLEEIHERERWTRPAAVARHRRRTGRFPAAPARRSQPLPGRHGAARRCRVRQPAVARRPVCRSGTRPHGGRSPVVFTGSSAERQRALDVARLAGSRRSAFWRGGCGWPNSWQPLRRPGWWCSADTGAAHLASAYSRPSVVLFGPAPAEVWGPPSGPHIVLTDAQARRGDTFAATPDPALLAVSVQDVLAAVAQLPLA